MSDKPTFFSYYDIFNTITFLLIIRNEIKGIVFIGRIYDALHTYISNWEIITYHKLAHHNTKSTK